MGSTTNLRERQLVSANVKSNRHPRDVFTVVDNDRLKNFDSTFEKFKPPCSG